MFERQERPPQSNVVGGYRLIPVTELFAAWWAYEQGAVRFMDLRTYFALHEMATRRRFMKSGRVARYTLKELAQLFGGASDKTLRGSLRRLQRAGISTWNTNNICFNEISELLGPAPTERLCKIANRKRKVPVPRWTIKLLARATKPVLVATILGHLFRCVYAKGCYIDGEGSISASWVAGVFNVDPRNVKRARAELRAINWLSTKPADHWHRQRYGGRVVVNLAWRSTGAQSPRRAVRSGSNLPLPEANKELPNGIQNQRLATENGFGFQKSDASKPRLRDVAPSDLRNIDRVLALYRQAQACGVVGTSESERLAFVGAAVHAARHANRNPGGFMWTLVRDKLWHHATAADEAEAQAMLKKRLFESLTKKEEQQLAEVHIRSSSADIRLVSHVTRSLEAHGYRGDPFEIFVQKAPQWTRQRWNRALCQWLTPSLASARDPVAAGDMEGLCNYNNRQRSYRYAERQCRVE